MNATEEWLRYIEDRAIMQKYGISGYTENKEETEENTKESDDV